MSNYYNRYHQYQQNQQKLYYKQKQPLFYIKSKHNQLLSTIMSWYLFNNSPERQYRGKKVDGYSNNNRSKIVLDWGLGQLSPKKQQFSQNSQYNRQDNYLLNQPKIHTIENQQYENKKINKNSRHKQKKVKAVQQAIRILTTQTSGSQAQQQKQVLLKVLKDYTRNKKPIIKEMKIQIINNNKKQQNLKQKPKSLNKKIYKNDTNTNNKSSNIFNNFQFNTDSIKNKKSFKSNYQQKKQKKNKNNNTNNYNGEQQQMRYDHQKQMRYLQSTLLPLAKQDNVTVALDHQLNNKLNTLNNVASVGLTDSRVSGKTHFGNKKNQSAVQLGHGFNVHKPLQQKVKDMNQKLKQMYRYDQWCKKRQSTNQFILG